MKTKSRIEMLNIANDIFSRYEKAKKIAITSDGMAFIVDKDDLNAKHHAKHNRYNKELSVEYFTRKDLTVKESKINLQVNWASKTAEVLIDVIEATAELYVVESILAQEKQGKKRKTVITAANERLSELKFE